MELMNYNTDNKKNSKAGIVAFCMFTLIGTFACFYMIANEPEPTLLGQDMYIPTTSTNIDVYSEKDVEDISYKVENEISKSTSGKFKSSIATPKITIDGEELEEINARIFNRFSERYNSVKNEVKDLENAFTYKVTYNKYETIIDNTKMLSFTFYERIIDNQTGEDVTYKLYGYTIDVAKKQIMTQEDVGLILLGSTYKNMIKEDVKYFVIREKLFDNETYNYVLTGLEEFYVKGEKLHIMFNPGEMGENKDYLDIVINK